MPSLRRSSQLRFRIAEKVWILLLALLLMLAVPAENAKEPYCHLKRVAVFFCPQI